MAPTVAATAHVIWLAFCVWTAHAWPPTVTDGTPTWSKPAPLRVRSVPPPAEPLRGAMAVIAGRYVNEREALEAAA